MLSEYRAIKIPVPSLGGEQRGQKVPGSLACSGMRDLITGAINEGSGGRAVAD